MELETKFYMNIKTGELSLEGSEDFVSTQMENIEDLVSLIQTVNILELNDTKDMEEEISDEDASKINDDSSANNNPKNSDLTVPDLFGEWLHKFKEDIGDQDQALITAYYVQQDSVSNDFKTSQINKSLKDHGIKLVSLSTTLKRIENKKLIFQTRKEGVLSFKRVSADGIKHLKTLLR